MGLPSAAQAWLATRCCLYPGLTATLLAFEEDAQWEPRLAEFNNCTGARITLRVLPGDEARDLEGEDLMPEALVSDVGRHGGGSGMYDGYIVAAPWLPPVVDFLEDLGPRITADANLVNWEDINSASRAAVSFGGSVRALPLDTDYIALGWREDVLTPRGAPVPDTIEALADLSEQLNGQDHNGDGEPDWGFCLTPQANYFYAFLAPVLQTHVRECAARGECKGVQTEQNPFFDTETFEPLVEGAGFQYAVAQYRRVLASSNCQEQKGSKGERKCNRKTAFPTGRCAGVISMPGTMTKLLLPWNGGGKYSPVVKDADGAVVWEPTWASGHWGRRARFPGSRKVLDRGTLAECTPTLCPKHEGGVNFAPFFSEGGESYALPQHSKGAQKNAMWDFFLWLAQLPPTLLPLSGQYRNSHLSEPAKQILQDAAWPPAMIEDLFAVLGAYFQPAEEGGNPVQDLLIPGFSDYMAALDKILNKEFLLNSQRTDEGRVLPSFAEDVLTDDDAFERNFPVLVDALKQAFGQVTAANGGRLVQLTRWRASLSLPERSPEALCAAQLGRAAYTALGCPDPVDLCAEHRSAVDGYDPNVCSADAGADLAFVLGVVCGVFGAVLAALGARAGLQRLRALRQAEKKVLLEMAAKVDAARKGTETLMYPMALVKAQDLLDAGEFIIHEKMRDTGKLVIADTLAGVEKLMATNSLVFISHQWLSWSGPDHRNAQFEALARAIEQLVTEKHWPDLENVLVWLDYTSIPQANRSIQSLAINSLPQYASHAPTFIVLAPLAHHKETEQVCNYASYQCRAWCRAEVLCHSLKHGTGSMFLATETGVTRLGPDCLGEALHVFSGDLSCCALKHKGMDLCDRQNLVLPILGLYGKLYAEKLDTAPAGRASATDLKTSMLSERQLDTDALFPRSFVLEREGSQTETECFGGLLQAMERAVDAERQDSPKAREPGPDQC